MFFYYFAVNQCKLSPQPQKMFNSYHCLRQSINNNISNVVTNDFVKLDCVDDVTCDVIISYYCHVYDSTL